MDIKSSDFFNLSTFTHTALFEKDPAPWIILTRLASYLKKLKLGVLLGSISPQAYLIRPEEITIGEGSIVEPGAYIQGPCWIGNHCVIRHGAYIRGHVITGDYCVIGHDTEVKNSLFLNRAHAAHFAYVGDTILGHDVNLGAGTKCANFKLDQQTVSVVYKHQRFNTQLRKFGAIIGDRSQIGCNTVTNPGSLIGMDVRAYPCLNIGGWIPHRSIVKPGSQVRISSY
ncbi:UDP-N-acetylglucosamine diphosphorylase [Candidatus Protochlamydia amoebophila]|nr:UDP-N-acetylglucosamine diphosphorylase [Candidatus Protochlamydia amoebophila]